MRRRLAPVLLVLGVLAALVWQRELFTVARPGERARPLEVAASARRVTPALDAVLPAVPVGMVRLRAGDAVQVVHYWAPWEQHAAAQARAVDSLAARLEGRGIRLAIVSFDPFPSVARWVRRAELRTPVLLDHRRALAAALPCPSIPYTYVLDRAGRIAVAQAGEVEWLAPATFALLDSVARAPLGSRQL